MSAIYVGEFYADEESAAKGHYGPEFLRDTWPAILPVIDARSPIFIIKNQSDSDRMFRAMLAGVRGSGGRLLEEGLYELPSIEHCSPKQVETLKYLSFYNGHLNVIFAVHLGSRDFARFLAQWPRFEIHRLGSEAAFAVEDWRPFGRRLSRIIEGRTLVGFGHDGAPLFIFSRDPELEAKLGMPTRR